LRAVTRHNRSRASSLVGYRREKWNSKSKTCRVTGAPTQSGAVTGADQVAKLDIDVATKVVRIESSLPSERLVGIIEEAGSHPTAKVF